MTVIRVIDFETTGMEPPAEVVEYGWCDLTRSDDGAWIVGEPQSHLYSVASIPPEVRAIHHIRPCDLPDDCPHFDEVEVHNPIENVAIFAAHNLDFEDKFIPSRILPGLCTYKAALRVWPEAPSHSNGALRYWLEDQGKIAPDHALTQPAHRAGPDAYVTAHILLALFNAGATGREMVAWTKEPRQLPTCPIGAEWRGKKWAEVDHGFLRWMTNNATMEADLKWNAQRELDRRATQRSN